MLNPLAALLLALFVAGPAWAQGGGSGGGGGGGQSGGAAPEKTLPPARAGSASTGEQDTAQERDFVAREARSYLAEDRLGRLAVQAAGIAAVVTFGRWMQADAAQGLSALRTAAAGSGAALPTGLDPAGQATLDRLRVLRGDAFDRAYLDAVIKDQQAASALLQRQGHAGQDPALNSYARLQLPTLQAHLQEAQDLQQRSPGGSKQPPALTVDQDALRRDEQQQLNSLKQAR